MAKGYILLHRQLWDNEIWKTKEPFDARSAWIDLLLMANHADNDCVMGKSVMKIKRGQLHTSYLNLAKRWRWSVNKVRRFFGILDELGMVHTNGTPNGTTVTLINYDVFQNQRHTHGTTNETTNGTTDGTTDGIQTKNVIKNERKNEEINKRSNRQTADDINAIFEKMRKEGKL